VYDLISGVIDFEDDADSVGEPGAACAMVQAGVSDELDEMKHMYAGLPDFLTQVAKEEMKRVPGELWQLGADDAGGGGLVLSISYIPKVGHAVRLAGAGTRPLCAPLAEALPDYSFGFEGETDEGYGAYYFCDRTRQLDDKFGDLFHRILGASVGCICASIV
jgi:DNA mismatch repair protein MSH5